MRTCDVNFVVALYHDCCLPEYFAGSEAEEVLAVPVWRNMTYREALSGARDTFHASSGYFDSVSGSGTLVEKALEELFTGVVLDEPADFTTDLPENSEDNESVYLYIGLWAGEEM